ncbi:NADH-quinone oxidoreductase subunit M [Nocardioides sp. KR10-350]|uniref:NADH-quinone oxidoreductase subunit M n=1 Tax=Nocardioides cheoyonin TaxID=3156615 RepID=UPI0032B334FE
MTLSLLCLVPFVGGLVSATVPARPKVWAFGFALATLVVAIIACAAADAEDHTWIGALGVHWALGLDGLGRLMVLLTAALVPIVMVAAVKDHGPRWYSWALVLEAFALVVFCAQDVFTFYVFFEATLIPAYFMIGGWGGAGRARAALKFLMYQLGGGLVLLGAVIGLFVESADAGTPSYLISDLQQLDIGTTAGRWIFVALFTAFAVKAPLFPLHTWLADTTEQATPPTSVLLVCVLDKIGTFGMIRLCLGLVPEASRWATPVVVALALVSIVYGAFLAIGQDDLLRLIGLTSLSHFGLITLGIFALSSQGVSGAILYMVNHGVATAAMFLVAGFLITRRGTASISSMRGLEKAAPVMAGLFLVAGLATAGLPGLSQFVSEILVLISAFDYHWFVGAIAVTAVVLAAIYVLWAYQRLFTGTVDPDEPAAAPTRDLTRREVGVLAPLVAGLLVFGFYPAPLLDAANPLVDDVLQHAGVTDAPPVVAAPEEGQ